MTLTSAQRGDFVEHVSRVIDGGEYERRQVTAEITKVDLGPSGATCACCGR
jgi:hypothetical protein